jgi:hypothetical protein
MTHKYSGVSPPTQKLCEPQPEGWGSGFEHFNEGDPSSSPGLYSAIPGKTVGEFPNPEGVYGRPWVRAPTQRDQIVANGCRCLDRRSVLQYGAAPQPRWGCEDHRCIPKVAEYSNLGLWAATLSELTPPTALGRLSAHPSVMPVLAFLSSLLVPRNQVVEILETERPREGIVHKG